MALTLHLPARSELCVLVLMSLLLCSAPCDFVDPARRIKRSLGRIATQPDGQATLLVLAFLYRHRVRGAAHCQKDRVSPAFIFIVRPGSVCISLLAKSWRPEGLDGVQAMELYPVFIL